MLLNEIDFDSPLDQLDQALCDAICAGDIIAGPLPFETRLERSMVFALSPSLGVLESEEIAEHQQHIAGLIDGVDAVERWSDQVKEDVSERIAKVVRLAAGAYAIKQHGDAVLQHITQAVRKIRSGAERN